MKHKLTMVLFVGFLVLDGCSKESQQVNETSHIIIERADLEDKEEDFSASNNPGTLGAENMETYTESMKKAVVRDDNISNTPSLDDQQSVEVSDSDNSKDTVEEKKEKKFEKSEEDYVKSKDETYSPGEILKEADLNVRASNEPSENGGSKNTLGIDGVSATKVVGVVNKYISLGQGQEAPDGSKVWSATSDRYSADIQQDADGNVYMACFGGYGEDAGEYLLACASSISLGAGEWISEAINDGEGTYSVGGMTFDLLSRGRGEFSLKVCSNSYINTLQDPN